jgi:hypothetical protein
MRTVQPRAKYGYRDGGVRQKHWKIDVWGEDGYSYFPSGIRGGFLGKKCFPIG